MRQPFELFHRLVQQVVMLVFYTLFLSVPGILASPVYFLARWYAERQVRHSPHSLPIVQVRGMEKCSPQSTILFEW